RVPVCQDFCIRNTNRRRCTLESLEMRIRDFADTIADSDPGLFVDWRLVHCQPQVEQRRSETASPQLSAEGKFRRFYSRRKCLAVGMAIALVVIGSLTCSLKRAYGSEVHTWTSSTGKSSIQAAFVRLEDTNLVVLEAKDGRLIRVPLSKLSSESQLLVRKLS